MSQKPAASQYTNKNPNNFLTNLSALEPPENKGIIQFYQCTGPKYGPYKKLDEANFAPYNPLLLQCSIL